ncbi:hypothetical protein B0T10DRAFT_552774 [Thelonectria olida]|uniref:Uncharacterized protein n=1 Tax=Thelonectria olida TaxID=1576542 RepID=A0A9P9ALM3_9HYPO|nr:hypothetical protein B0T10DRAFT_552774 [Thelonectria olida]
MSVLARFDNESALDELLQDLSTTTQPSNPFSTIDGADFQLNQAVSRIVSASQSTTLFTAITPYQTIEAITSTVSSIPQTTSGTQDPVSPTPNLNKLIEIGIAFVVLVAVVIVVLSVFLIRRHRGSLRNRKQKDEPKTINYTDWQYVDVQTPSAAHLPPTTAHPPNNGLGRPPTRGREMTQASRQGTLPPAYSAGHNANPMSAPRWR